MKRLSKILLYRKRVLLHYINIVLQVLNILTYIASAIFLFALVFEYGFIVEQEDLSSIHSIYSFTWIIFIVNSLAHIVLKYRETKRKYRKLAWVMTIMLYLTLIPVVFPSAGDVSAVKFVWSILNSNIYLAVVLGLLSFLQMANGVVLVLGKRVNPALIFSISFFVIILIGAGLLMLPKATYQGISFLDALFTSTSATCVTGLSTVDISSTFTPMGLLFIMLLIQIGGVGVMTLTSFFAIFFMGNASIHNQTMMCDMVSSKSLGSLFSTLIYILAFTVIIEVVGAILIFFNIHGTMDMTLNEEIGFSIFHSISAFCNAGFSTLSNNLGNEMLLGGGHNLFYLTISGLVVLGGIGFPILVNISSTLKYYWRRIKARLGDRKLRVERRVHLYDINTRIAVYMTLILLVVGAVGIALMEWNNSFEGMTVWEKCVHSIFNAASPRTAGFNSVSTSMFNSQTLLLIIGLMIIGGGTQSTAGGIKVNVFAVVLLNLKAIIVGDERVTVFNRELSVDSVRRSNSTLVMYFMLIFVAFFMLIVFEPDKSLLSLLFEAISALSTVGLSLDLTPTLGSDSKVVVIFLMFIGRVGVLTMMASLIKQHRIKRVKYPSGNIIIN